MQSAGKFILFISLFSILSCNNEIKNVLTEQEKVILDGLGFDKEIVNEVKAKVNLPFKIMESENRSGKEIPKNMMPVMLYFKAEKSFDISFIEDIKSNNNSKKGYNVYSIDQNDGKLTIIISKL
jgi:hypothetical protein